MRLISLALAALLILIQIPLWIGKGGWFRVAELENEVAKAQVHAEKLRARNAKFDSEVRDLREGTGAVEERARLELNMIRQNEVFVQFLKPEDAAKESATPPPPPKPEKPAKSKP